MPVALVFKYWDLWETRAEQDMLDLLAATEPLRVQLCIQHSFRSGVRPTDRLERRAEFDASATQNFFHLPRLACRTKPAGA